MSFVQREGITYLELTFWACGERDCDKEIIKLEKFVITGGKPLHGEVIISGAKNAAVGILPATILAADVCVIENLPDISDVAVSLKILSVLGAKVRMLNKNTYEIDTTHLTGTNVPDDLSRQMRASYYFLGALLSRFGRAQVAMPGGCNLGPRPIDQHLKVFSALGAEDSVDYGMITVRAKELNGAHIFFDKVSVGATMNGMLSAVMAKGQTILENCAKEPHVVSVNNISAEVAYAPTIDEICLYGLDESGMIDKYAQDLKEVEQREGKAYLVGLMKQTGFGYGYGWQNWVRSTAIDESAVYYYETATKIASLLQRRVASANATDKPHYQAMLFAVKQMLGNK